MILFQRQVAWTYLQGLVLALVCGILGALAAQVFRWALDQSGALMFGSYADISEVLSRLPWYARLSIPAVGGAIAGGVLLVAQRRERGTVAHVDYLESIDARSEPIPIASSLLRCLSSFFSIVSGGSVGKEGAMVQLSATVASALGQRFRLDGERFQLAIAMAATGGLAAVYHTPLAAAVFIAEIAFGGIEIRRIGFLFTAAVGATWLISMMGHYAPLYHLPAYQFDVQSSAVLAVVIVGVAAGAVGSFFLAGIRYSRIQFTRLHRSVVVRMTLGGLIVGAIIIVAPEVAGNGFEPISRLLAGDELSVSIVALLVLKIIATTATVGSGAIGGLFTPALLLGALVGAACAPILSHMFGLPESTIMLGVVGMAAALSATTQAPLMSTLMVFEMTQQSTFIFPLMLATVVAYATSNILGQTGVYAVIARHRARFASRNNLYEATVRGIMRLPERLVPASSSLDVAMQVGMQQKNRFVFIVDDKQSFIGAIWVQDLMAAREKAELPASALWDMANRDFPVVYADQKIFDVWQTVIESPAERTPVLDNAASRTVVGLLQKSDLLKEARNLFV